MNYVSFLKGAEKRYHEGRLYMKVADNYPINPVQFDSWVEHQTHPIAKTLAQWIRICTTHVSFREFHDAFKALLEKFNESNYDIIIPDWQENKSNYWLSQMFVYELSLYNTNRSLPKSLPNSIDFLDYPSSSPKDNHTYVFVDDAAYSGEQIKASILRWIEKWQRFLLQNLTKIKILFLVPYITKRAQEDILKNVQKRLVKIGLEDKVKFEILYSVEMLTLLEKLQELKELQSLVGPFVLQSNLGKTYSIDEPSHHEFINSQLTKWFLPGKLEWNWNYDIARNVPIYFDHKVADALSSFPTIYQGGIVKDSKPIIFINCETREPALNANYLVNSKNQNVCIPSFYKYPTSKSLRPVESQTGGGHPLRQGKLTSRKLRTEKSTGRVYVMLANNKWFLDENRGKYRYTSNRTMITFRI